jgi:hypothetical protein
MKKNNLKLWMAALAVSSLLFTAACKKNSDATNEGNEQENTMIAAEDDAVSETVYNTVFDDVMGVDDEVGMAGTGFMGARSAGGSGVSEVNGPDGVNGVDSAGGYACLNITRERLNPPNRFPVKITMDFGAGCTGRDGHFRKGKIVTIYTGALPLGGSVATTTFVGYQVDSFAVEGTHIIKNISLPPAAIKYEVKVEGGKITNVNNGKYRTRNALHVIQQVGGMLTPFNPFDDVFQITGGARGETNRPGYIVNWGRTILAAEPVIKKFTCHWFVKGQVKIERSNAPTAVLDYGDGDCDNKATITVNGVTREIRLPW